jgi:hypothetical protein
MEVRKKINKNQRGPRFASQPMKSLSLTNMGSCCGSVEVRKKINENQKDPGFDPQTLTVF